MKKPLVIAILAKSVEHILPLYLKSIECQSAIDDNTIFYVRTNDNKDNTAHVLWDWLSKMNKRHEIYFDDTSIYPKLKELENHDWSDHTRFKILGEIRQKSIDFAIERGADYFIADCDNITLPHTIDSLRNLNLPVVAPLLHTIYPDSLYSNFHSSIDENGYFLSDEIYQKLYNRTIKGIIELPVIHCTYFIKNEALPFVKYDDLSGRYEYVIFSDSLRKSGIPQYLDNRSYYGSIFFTNTKDEFSRDINYEPAKKLLEFYNL
jgi:hypothetical protein